MSEYQYYEFQALDRRLSREEMAEIDKLSSRVQLTPTAAIFTYHFGDFRGNPKEVLTKYFDVMFYIANWGTWQLMFKFPRALVARKWFEPYELEDIITITQNNKYIIIDIEIFEENGLVGWVEGEGWLPRLLPLREELLVGDLRLLYLVWLRVADLLSPAIAEEEAQEPPIPPNLNQLSEAQLAFIELVELDLDLVTAAAQASSIYHPPSELPLSNWLNALSEAEKNKFLLKLIKREPYVDLQLINRLKELALDPRTIPTPKAGFRKFSELQKSADVIQAERLEQERILARKKRIQELEALASKEDYIWKRIMDLIAKKQSKPYDEALDGDNRAKALSV
ncbi:MAG: hypothetical protein QNJ54_30705 [Prochloraceae cyanobacterium]|nr:hypothetical protein [Prochloraceae cyanobacterium]